MIFFIIGLAFGWIICLLMIAAHEKHVQKNDQT